MTDLVKIWSFEHDAWWRPNSCGYTTVEADAGLYERKVAEDIVSRANHGGELNEGIVEIGASPSKRQAAAPISPMVEKAARAMANVQRQSEGKPPFMDEEWGKDFWDWYQELKGVSNGGSFVHQSLPAKLERQALAALAACEAEEMRDMLARLTKRLEALPTSTRFLADDEAIRDARALLARLEAKA